MFRNIIRRLLDVSVKKGGIESISDHYIVKGRLRMRLLNVGRY